MYRLKGILGCLIDLAIQVYLTVVGLFAGEPELDEHEEKISS
jgi:hypothetical protein